MKEVMLDPADFVGMSFWIISAAMTAATFFFFMERDRAVGKWKTSLSVAALVTGIAAIHYFYMREVWIVSGTSPTTFRYVDWLLTVPLQIIEFYLILTAIAVVRSALFWKLMAASVVMLVFGYFGEIRSINVWGAFVISMLAWLFIIYEVFLGEASKISAENGTEASKKAFNALRIIVTVGWAIYPLGYVLGYTGGGSENMLNIVYNLADFVNKIAFGVVIWAAATSSSHEQTS
ncbi:biphenyl 2,3-dioxygenase [Pseudoalteromonas phenolica]|jgi:bacteriorhodopsin|uniref:Biphenyl 2,3-dioxygenase n=1 Tax=Pseudoalteromonas phenolica TaxID=161398 RepID=A0A4V2EJW6_9GAMM|nr:bacteriorhodopsin-like [Pseudoalteromonas phenolica]RZQ53778.1 biphenyl 2,3-dioxygenase [Pseudoalteromonas phenolica]TMN88157.1 biphenyl 2,3-dioxygenase [Pseudoalteromonas phenolica]TMP80600.1 biphenyl 2,3-dioxygenase [Pseudoalteromonas phenolica]